MLHVHAYFTTSPHTNTYVHSIFCVIFVVIAMTVDTTLYWTTNTNVSISDQTIQLFPVSFPGSITAISYCSLSFVCQFNIVRLQKELRGRPTKLRLYAINIGYAVIAYTIFNIAVFAGYFRVSVSDNFVPEDQYIYL